MADAGDEIPVATEPTAEEIAAAEAAAAALAARQQELFMAGLSRLDRVFDDSGFAFTAVDVVDQGLVNMDPIRGYPHLQFVSLAKNQIADASHLAGLQYLVCVDFAENVFTTPPAFVNPYLQAIDLSRNQLTTIEGLTSASVSSLKINDNQLESLVGVSGLPSLVILEASRNGIADLVGLGPESAKLERLELNENKLTSLAGIEALTNLNWLSVAQNNLDTLEATEKLTALESLRELDLSLNPVNDTENYRLQMILRLPWLKKLDGELISDQERLAAVEFKERQEAAARAAEAESEP